jgi:Cu+-exporting ATPase
VEFAKLQAAVEGAGYGARQIAAFEWIHSPQAGASADSSEPTGAEPWSQELKAHLLRLVIAGTLALPVVVISMGDFDFPGRNWLLWLLTTPVVFWCGASFFVGAWRNLRRGTADMNTLIALGTGSAYLASVAATLFPAAMQPVLPGGHTDAGAHGSMPPVYFEAAATITFFVLLGRLLEERARGKTSEAIRRLMGLQARVATVVREGVEQQVAITDVAEAHAISVNAAVAAETITITQAVCTRVSATRGQWSVAGTSTIRTTNTIQLYTTASVPADLTSNRLGTARAVSTNGTWRYATSAGPACVTPISLRTSATGTTRSNLAVTLR